MPKKTTIYSVSQVNSLIKTALEENLPSRLAVAGEITDWVVARSGHAYFSLKDENALLPCVMWKSKFGKVKFDIENGQAVVVRGRVCPISSGNHATSASERWVMRQFCQDYSDLASRGMKSKYFWAQKLHSQAELRLFF